MPTEKELAMQRKQDELQQQQQADANAVLTTQPASLGRELTPKEQSMVNMTQALNPETKVEAPAVEQTKPTYLADYTTDTDLWGIAKRQNKPLQDVFNDYQKWGRETGNNTDFLPMWTAAQKGDVSKSPQEIEKEQKKQQRQEKWEKIGNFLSHLGNFIGAAAFGAPSQTLEPAQQLTARQQAVREKTEALRRAYNDRFFEQISKQRAQDRQAELDKQNSEINRKKMELQEERLKDQQRRTEIADFNAQANKEFRNASLDLKSRALDIKEAVSNGQLSVAQGRLALQRLKEGRLAGGTETNTTVTKQTPFGKQTTTTKKSTRPASSSSKKPQRKKIDY